MISWQKIWQNKNIINCDDLEHLLLVSGFSEAGLTRKAWQDYTNNIKSKLNITDSTAIFEFGCGAGAFLSSFVNNHNKLGGIDLSQNFINNIKSIFPNGDFQCGDFLTTDICDSYDVVVCNSVFQYLSDYENATKVLNKMLALGTDNFKIAVLDINNEETQKLYDTTRAEEKNMSLSDYQKLYTDTPHMFYSKQFFEDYAKTNNMKIRIFNQNISGYINNQFRFNVIMEK